MLLKQKVGMSSFILPDYLSGKVGRIFLDYNPLGGVVESVVGKKSRAAPRGGAFPSGNGPVLRKQSCEYSPANTALQIQPCKYSLLKTVSKNPRKTLQKNMGYLFPLCRRKNRKFARYLPRNSVAGSTEGSARPASGGLGGVMSGRG
jgi:hypothetical protein